METDLILLLICTGTQFKKIYLHMAQIMKLGIKIFIKLDYFQNFYKPNLNFLSITLALLSYNSTNLLLQEDILLISSVYQLTLLKVLTEFMKMKKELTKYCQTSNG